MTLQYKHECIEYDGLEIDEFCLEFSNCLCFDDPLAKRFKELHSSYFNQICILTSMVNALKKRDKK